MVAFQLKGARGAVNKRAAVKAVSESYAGKGTPKAKAMEKGLGALVGGLRQRSCMSGAREVLLRRPVLFLRATNNDIDVAPGENIFEKIVASTAWGTGGLGTDNNRIILSRDQDPTKNYSLAQNRYVRWIRPYLSVYASTPGVVVDHELSKQIARLINSNCALIVDMDGKGKNLALAPSLFSHCTKQGIILGEDQIFVFDDNSEISFDYKGEGEIDDYTAADKKAGGAMNLAVEIGCDIILTDTPSEDIDDLIEQAMESAT